MIIRAVRGDTSSLEKACLEAGFEGKEGEGVTDMLGGGGSSRHRGQNKCSLLGSNVWGE